MLLLHSGFLRLAGTGFAQQANPQPLLMERHVKFPETVLSRHCEERGPERRGNLVPESTTEEQDRSVRRIVPSVKSCWYRFKAVPRMRT